MAHLDDRKSALAANLQRARAQMGVYRVDLAEDMNVGARLKESVKEHRGVWLAATTIFGLILTRLILPRPKKVVVDRSLRRKKEVKEVEKASALGALVGLLKFAFDIARPALISWASRRVAERYR